MKDTTPESSASRPFHWPSMLTFLFIYSVYAAWILLFGWIALQVINHGRRAGTAIINFIE